MRKLLQWLVLMATLMAHPTKAISMRRQSRGSMREKRSRRQISIAGLHFARASWYGREFAGRKMANGHPFDPRKMTAASLHYPLGTRLELYALRTNRKVVVTITDRGPFSHKADLDISLAAAVALDIKERGVAIVRVRKLA